jgi:hypothetical protein
VDARSTVHCHGRCIGVSRVCSAFWMSQRVHSRGLPSRGVSCLTLFLVPLPQNFGDHAPLEEVMAAAKKAAGQ